MFFTINLFTFVFMKKCKTCGKTKAGMSFYAKRSNLDGLHSDCIECCKGKRRLRYKHNTDRQERKEKKELAGLLGFIELKKLEVSKEQEVFYEERRKFYLNKYGPLSEYYLRRFGDGSVFSKIKFKWDIFSR